jgi:hypothetical protein
MVSEDQKELFLVRRWSIALLALLLVGCEQELLKEKVDLLEAVMFTVEGIENNIQQQHRFEPVRRTIVGQTIMYTSMGRNSYGFSDDSMNKKVGDSSFVRYTEKISSLENCVFRKESLVEFSKGNSKEDFSVHDETGERPNPQYAFPGHTFLMTASAFSRRKNEGDLS